MSEPVTGPWRDGDVTTCAVCGHAVWVAIGDGRQVWTHRAPATGGHPAKPSPVRWADVDEQILFNLGNLSTTTQRAACQALGLPVSGTKLARAKRLAKAGWTAPQVEQAYGWRARRADREAPGA